MVTDNRAAADRYIEKKRKILPISYHLSKSAIHREPPKKMLLDVDNTIAKLKVKVEAQDKAIKQIHHDLNINNIVINIDSSDDECAN